MKNRVEELAKDMNVSASDVLCLAKSVVNSIVKDGAGNVFLTCTNDERKSLTESYIIHAVKKIEKFQTIFLTNPEAKEVFTRKVLAII
jgi:hypothetical protein